MLVVTRFRVPEDDETSFRADLGRAVEVLAARTGFVGSRSGRNVDDPALWVLVTEWAGVGDYRRALSSYDVKVGAAALWGRALQEPSAYETDDPSLG